jgi:hypothetical protein
MFGRSDEVLVWPGRLLPMTKKRKPARKRRSMLPPRSSPIVGEFVCKFAHRPPAPVAVRYPRSPISFLAGHVACTAQYRTTPASDWGPGPIRGNPENRNSPLRIMRLIISDHFPKLGITCYGLDTALSAHCMSSILCNTGLRRLIVRRLS